MNFFNQLKSGAKDVFSATVALSKGNPDPVIGLALGILLNAKQITEPETKTTVRRIDGKQQLELHLHLKGEATPTDLTISYQITPENEIELLGIESAKPWITNTIALLLAKEKIKFLPKDLLIAIPNKAVPLTSEMILSFLR